MGTPAGGWLVCQLAASFTGSSMHQHISLGSLHCRSITLSAHFLTSVRDHWHAEGEHLQAQTGLMICSATYMPSCPRKLMAFHSSSNLSKALCTCLYLALASMQVTDVCCHYLGLVAQIQSPL